MTSTSGRSQIVPFCVVRLPTVPTHETRPGYTRTLDDSLRMLRRICPFRLGRTPKHLNFPLYILLPVLLNSPCFRQRRGGRDDPSKGAGDVVGSSRLSSWGPQTHTDILTLVSRLRTDRQVVRWIARRTVVYGGLALSLWPLPYEPVYNGFLPRLNTNIVRGRPSRIVSSL